MDKIDIKDFDEEAIYFWNCPTCDHQNEIYEDPYFEETVFCIKCGNTFEIVK
jgi:ribosomal protein S27E